MRNAIEQLHYLQGKIDGIEDYAWMKDGMTYVGTCGTTLKEATKALKLEIGKIQESLSQNKEDIGE